MKISVIIPCYNAARYLAECLDSVLAQQGAEIQVILIDDGSSDETYTIATRYQQKDSRVIAIRQENAGVSAARNRGLEEADGDWVTFVDSDDILVPDAFSAMLSAADDDVDMVVCAHETFDEQGRTETFWPQTRWMDMKGERRKAAMTARLIEGDSVLNIMCNKLHRRSLIEREKLRLVPGVAIAEDALFNLEAVLCGRGVAYVHRVTYRYRMHGASATQRRAASEFDVHRPWFQAMRELLLRRGVMERWYGAYVDSVVLRLYKDGGLPGVIRTFGSLASPILHIPEINMGKMTGAGRLLLRLCRNGGYVYVYPLVLPVQIIRRKIEQAAFLIRRNRERPQ